MRIQLQMNRVQVGDLEMAVLDRGAGPVVLLAHGFPLDHRMWTPTVEALADDCRLIAPDLRGFGATGVTPGVVTMEQMADDLAALLDMLEVDQPVHFCGLSMGGYIGWQFWRKHRDRLRSLILCDTRAAADSDEAAAGRRKMAAHVLAHGTSAIADAMLPKLFSQASRAGQSGAIAAVRTMIAEANPIGIAAAQHGMAARPDMTQQLVQIAVPALLIVGDEDQITPVTEMRAMAAAMPQSELVVVPNAGHMAPLEQPEVVNAAIRRFVLNRS